MVKIMTEEQKERVRQFKIQCSLYNHHKKLLENYYESRAYLFMPEIIEGMTSYKGNSEKVKLNIANEHMDISYIEENIENVDRTLHKIKMLYGEHMKDVIKAYWIDGIPLQTFTGKKNSSLRTLERNINEICSNIF